MQAERVERIYTDNYHFMLKLAYGHTRSVPEAQEVVQECSLRMLNSQSEANLPDRSIAYKVAEQSSHKFLQSLRAECRDYRKIEPLDLENPHHHPTVPSAEDEALKKMELEEALKTTPWEVRMAAYGYSLREISRLTKLPEQTIYYRVWSWRQRQKTLQNP